MIKNLTNILNMQLLSGAKAYHHQIDISQLIRNHIIRK